MFGKILCLAGGIAIGYLARETISELVDEVASVWRDSHSSAIDASSSDEADEAAAS